MLYISVIINAIWIKNREVGYKVKILYYDWGSNSSKDICEVFNRLGIEYESFSYSIHNYETDDEFSKYVKHILSKKQFDCIFRLIIFPLLRILHRNVKCCITHGYMIAHIIRCIQNRFTVNITEYFFDREQCKYFHARA